VRRCLLLGREDAGALQRDVDAELFVRQLGRVLDRGNPDLLVVDQDVVAGDLTSAGKRPWMESYRSR
jgi:hypothetical protein